MGYASLSVLASFTLLVAYSVLTSGAVALTNSINPTQSTEALHKRPSSSIWLKSLPIRRLKPYGYSLYQRDFPDVEFVEDSVNSVDKRYDDDYGHMRFGKRSGGEDDGFDDYGHMRFGR